MEVVIPAAVRNGKDDDIKKRGDGVASRESRRAAGVSRLMASRKVWSVRAIDEWADIHRSPFELQKPGFSREPEG